MKYFLLVGLMMMVVGKSWGQVQTHRDIDKFTGDTTVVTDEDTLRVTQINKRKSYNRETVEGYVTKTHNGRFYSLYIDFTGPDVYSLSKENNAYFKMEDNSIIKIPYDGDYNIFSESEKASFVVDISSYIDKFSTMNIQSIRLETSKFFNDIDLADRFQAKIKNIVVALMNSH